MDGVYSESGTELQLDEAVTIDAHELIDGGNIPLNRLACYGQPILEGCKSRFADKCRGVVKNAVEASLPSILSECRTDEQLWAIRSVLSRLNALYPLSATICASYVAVLKSLSLYEEATEEVAEFETDWLEAYGAHDRPDIDTLVQKLTRTTNEPTRLEGAN
jgi:hypothetical protein